jgi:hypothetical protein
MTTHPMESPMNDTRPELFNDVVAHLRGGATLDELSETLKERVKASRDTGKVSTLILELMIRPQRPTREYELADKIKTKFPELDRGVTLLAGTPDGNLERASAHLQSPHQRSFVCPTQESGGVI